MLFSWAVLIGGTLLIARAGVAKGAFKSMKEGVTILLLAIAVLLGLSVLTAYPVAGKLLPGESLAGWVILTLAVALPTFSALAFKVAPSGKKGATMCVTAAATLVFGTPVTYKGFEVFNASQLADRVETVFLAGESRYVPARSKSPPQYLVVYRSETSDGRHIKARLRYVSKETFDAKSWSKRALQITAKGRLGKRVELEWRRLDSEPAQDVN